MADIGNCVLYSGLCEIDEEYPDNQRKWRPAYGFMKYQPSPWITSLSPISKGSVSIGWCCFHDVKVYFNQVIHDILTALHIELNEIFL